MELRREQEERFHLLVQAQEEDRRAIRSLLGQEVRPAAAPPIAHVPLVKMGPQDDPEAFVDLFEKTAEACGWDRTQWPVRLIPLLSGEAQVAAQQLPVENLLAYADLKRAILQRVGRSPEQHRQRFRSVDLGDSGRPFILAQQLRDACRRWLMAEARDVGAVVDLVVLEQFVARLPSGTAEWVQCQRPASLDQAIQLAEDHLAACPGVGEPPSNLSLSLSPNLPPLFPDLFLHLGHGAIYPLEPHSVEQRSWGTDQGHEGAWQRTPVPLHQLHLLSLSANLLALLLPLGWGESLGQPAGGAGIRGISRIGVL